MPQPLVRFHGVRKSFAGAPLVVRDLTLEIERGEFLTLLGPSGSGKTTILMMLAGFERPDAGAILLDGRPANRVAPHRRGIGMVFQHSTLFPHLDVAENVGFPLRVRRVGRAECGERVARALDMARLAGLGQRRPSQLSGGQQQRVALARALVCEPPLLLMDEPLGALDRALRDEMQFEIRALHARLGLTVVYVTHDQTEAMAMSERVAVFAQGRVQQLGSPKALYDAPANAFVAGFVGENNLLPGRIEALHDDGAEIRLDCGPVVEAEPGDGACVGARCVVAVRPERIAVAAVTAAEMGEGAIAARLIEAIFLGDHLRLRLAVGDAEVTVSRPAGAAMRGLTPGAAVAIAWQSHHARALAAEPAMQKASADLTNTILARCDTSDAGVRLARPVRTGAASGDSGLFDTGLRE